MTPVPDEHGNVSQLVGSVRDITIERQTQEDLARLNADLERRVRQRTEELELANNGLAASQSKSQFLANMSHELRTPLTAIIGFSELLLNEQQWKVDEAARKQYLQHVNESGEHLLTLINDVLDLSKVEAGRMELALETVSVQSPLQRHQVHP